MYGVDAVLNPRQQYIYDQLLDADAERPVYEANIGLALHQYIEAELDGDVPNVPEARKLFVNKRSLEAIHSCEARWYGDEWTGWAVPMLRGTLSHKAIERLVMGQYKLTDEPTTLVNDALARMRNDEYDQERWQFLNNLCDEELHELSSASIRDLMTFTADWPQLPLAWTPCMEQSRRYDDLFDKNVVLKGKYDLSLGKPDGTRAKRVIIDMKTGNVQGTHAPEARFYALLETLRQGVPPFRVGSYYLESGNLALEYVNEDLLFQAASRLADGIRKMWQINAGRDAQAQPSGFCSHCSLYLGCPAGIEFIEKRDCA